MSDIQRVDLPDEFRPPFHKVLDIQVGLGPNREGIAWVDVDRQKHYGSRWAHGGVAAALVDIASGVVIAQRFENPMRAIEGTIELKLNFIRKVMDGDMTATARLLHLGKRVAVTEVDVTNKGDLCAKAIATFMLAVPKQ